MSVKINSVIRKFPIYSDRLVIKALGIRSINAYANEIRQPYYSEYSDSKVPTTISEENIKKTLTKLVIWYRTPGIFNTEARLLITDRFNGNLIGTLVLNPVDADEFIELAYAIIPLHQGKGYGTEALNRLNRFVLDTFNKVQGVKLFIQEQNRASIRIAEKCNFSLSGTKTGKYGNILVYEIRR